MTPPALTSWSFVDSRSIAALTNNDYISVIYGGYVDATQPDTPSAFCPWDGVQTDGDNVFSLVCTATINPTASFGHMCEIFAQSTTPLINTATTPTPLWNVVSKPENEKIASFVISDPQTYSWRCEDIMSAEWYDCEDPTYVGFIKDYYQCDQPDACGCAIPRIPHCTADGPHPTHVDNTTLCTQTTSKPTFSPVFIPRGIAQCQACATNIRTLYNWRPKCDQPPQIP